MAWVRRLKIDDMLEILGRKAAQIDCMRSGRKERITHAIDAPDPHIPADRDDGIFVEETPAGYRVSVTIADIAARVPRYSPLMHLGWRRGFTRYQKMLAKRDSMFPRMLEDAASLEHGRSNFGLAVVMEFDHSFQLQHSALERVIVKPDNTTYRLAGHMASTQPESDYHLIAKVAGALRRRYFNSDVMDLMRNLNGQSSLRYREENEAAMMKHVETFMLMANMITAGIAEKADLAYIYRNFGDKTDEDGIKRAYYATNATQHEAFKQVAGSKAYCHVTSPIRRGADFYNQHQLHYVIDVMERLQQKLTELAPEIDQQSLHSVLWRHVAELVKHAQHYHAHQSDSRSAMAAKQALTQFLVRTLLPELGMEEHSESMRGVANEVLALGVPFTRAQLEKYASTINTLIRQDASHQSEVDADDAQKSREDALKREANSDFSGQDSTQITSKLRTAARSESGEMPEALYKELRSRIKSGSKQALDWVDAAVYILIVARFPKDPQWRRLKKDMCKHLKKNPELVSTVLANAQMKLDRYRDLTFPEQSIISLTDEKASAVAGYESFQKVLNSLRSGVSADLFVLRLENEVVCAPTISIGSSGKTARAHAGYSLLEHYAFGEMVNLEEVAVPDLLYKDLEQRETEREQILRGIAQRAGMHEPNIREVPLADHEKRFPSQHRVEVRLSGGKLFNEIRTQADDADIDMARRKAVSRMLRHTQFQIASQREQFFDILFAARPFEHLQYFVESQNQLNDPDVPQWSVKQTMREHTKSRRSEFNALVTLTTPYGNLTYEGHARSKEAALAAACLKVIEGFELRVDIPPQITSWAGRHRLRSGVVASERI